MKKVLSVCMLACALGAAVAAQAQSANDINLPVTGQGLSLVGPVVPAGGGGAVCPSGPIQSAFTGANTQDGRIFRDGIPAVCPIKVYPGNFGTGTTFNYETFTYNNTSAAAACVTVNFDPDTVGATPCTTNAHMSAYAGSYDPANQGSNFLGDVGSSLAQPFNIEVAANSQLVLAVTNTSSAAICTFGFEVVNLPCSAATSADLGITVTGTPATAAPDTPVSFFATSTNLGPDSAQDVTVSIDLAQGFRFQSLSPAPATCSNPGVGNAGLVSCTFAGATPAGGQHFLQVTATAPNPGLSSVVASTSSLTTDPSPGNNVSTSAISIAAPYVNIPVPSQTTLGLLLMGLLLAGLGWVGVAARRRA